MSEPLKKPAPAPESYTPREMPEIMKLAEQGILQTQNLTENVLRGVPKAPSDDFEGITHFPKFLKVALDYLGDELDYTFAIVASGGAFRLSWDTAGWNGGSGDISHTYDNAEATFRNGITALGREFRMLWRDGNEFGHPGNGTKEDFKAFIKEQIDRGFPVISLGPVGPPEAGIILGYRDGGDTLLGWSDFQSWDWKDFDEEGHFVTDTWWKDGEGNQIRAVMSLGEITGPRVGEKEILHNAAAALEGRRDGSFAKGVAAYDAWKNALLGAKRKDVKGKIEGNDMGGWLLLVAHGEPLNTLADGRKNAYRYFTQLAKAYPEQPVYAEIAAQFGTLVEILLKKVYGAMRSKAPHGFECGKKQRRAMARASVRRKIAGYIDEMKAADEKALALMKQLLAPEGYTPREMPEIMKLAQQAQNGDTAKPPRRHAIEPAEKIVKYDGDKWPFSNVHSAALQAAGLLYGRTDQHNDAEYSIQNALTGEAFGLFYAPDAAWTRSPGTGIYGLRGVRLHNPSCGADELRGLVRRHVAGGNAVIVRKLEAARAYLVFGYRRGGKRLLCCEFEDGNDWRNCSYDFGKPAVLKKWTDGVTELLLWEQDGPRLSRGAAYRQALAEGCRLLTLQTPDAGMDIEKLQGAGQPLFDEWVNRLEQANAENREQFFEMIPEVFPGFIALYENRLHLWKFMNACAAMYGSAALDKAAALCGQLKDLAMRAAAQSNSCSWEHDEMPETAGWDQHLLPKEATPNERRGAMLEKLGACRALEIEIARNIQLFLEGSR